MQLWRYSGLFLMATGVLHNLIGFILGWGIIVEVGAEGLWDRVDMQLAGDSLHTRAELLWFLLLGFSWIIIGMLFHSNITKHRVVPEKVYGWIFLAKGILVSILIPVSGAWLFIPQGLIILLGQAQSANAIHPDNNK